MPGRSWRDVAPCGTDAGYQRHRYRKEEPCGPCREAHTSYRAGERLEKKLTAAGVDMQRWGAMGYDDREDLLWGLRRVRAYWRDKTGRFAGRQVTA